MLASVSKLDVVINMQKILKRKPKDEINRDVNIVVDILLRRMDDIDGKIDLLLEQGSIDSTEGVQVERGRILKLNR